MLGLDMHCVLFCILGYTYNGEAVCKKANSNRVHFIVTGGKQLHLQTSDC
jgi:hypothetical protein